jgi:hypothetical protein
MKKGKEGKNLNQKKLPDRKGSKCTSGLANSTECSYQIWKAHDLVWVSA